MERIANKLIVIEAERKKVEIFAWAGKSDFTDEQALNSVMGYAFLTEENARYGRKKAFRQT